MVKSELVELLASKASVTSTQSEDLVNLFFNSIIDSLTTEGRVEIRGFGAFTIRRYPAREGRNPKTLSATERFYRQEQQLLANSVLILNLLNEKTPEAIAKIAKFKEFLNKNNLAICSCGLLKDIKQCHDKCMIVINKEFKINPFIQFLKNKSQRLGRKFEEKEILQHLQYVNRNLKWDAATLNSQLKAVMSKWSTFILNDVATTKVHQVSNKLPRNKNVEEEEDVSYGENDLGQY